MESSTANEVEPDKSSTQQPQSMQPSKYDLTNRYPWTRNYPDVVAKYLAGQIDEDKVAEMDSRYHAWCRQRDGKQRDRERQLQVVLAAMGKRYAECSLDNFIATSDAQKAALAKVREYVENFKTHNENGSGLLLYGPSGTGKDHLLTGVVRELFARGHYVHWRNGLDFFCELRATFNDPTTSEAAVCRRLESAEILALSDPVPPRVDGSDRNSGALSSFEATTLLRILDERYRDGKVVLCTLNVASGKELSDRLGAPLADRLRDAAVTVACDWPSHRKPLR